MILIFCEYHFKLFRENGITKILTDNPKAEIRIMKHGKRSTVCNKEHCIDKAEYDMEILE